MTTPRTTTEEPPVTTDPQPPTLGPDPGPEPDDDRRVYRTELEHWRSGWVLYVDLQLVASTPEHLSPEDAQAWACRQLGEGVQFLPGRFPHAPQDYFVASPGPEGWAPTDDELVAAGQPTPLLGALPVRIAIDADCPGCGYPERSFDVVTRMFGCSSLNPTQCGYTSASRES